MTTTPIGNRPLSSPPAWSVVDAFAEERKNRGLFPEPIGNLRVLLEEQKVGGQFRPLNPPLTIRYIKSGSGAFILTMTAAPDAARPAGSVKVPEGTYRVRVVSDFYQQESFEAALVEGAVLPQPLRLKPNYAYPFPTSSRLPGGLGLTLLRGGVRAPDGRGIAGAIVKALAPLPVGPFGEYTTEASGQWMLIFPEETPLPQAGVTVRFELPSGTVVVLADVHVVQGRENGLAQTALRGSVRATGRPVSGARIQVGGASGEAATEPSGNWFFYFDLDQPDANVTVTVTLPDGRSQSQSHAVRARAVSSIPQFVFP